MAVEETVLTQQLAGLDALEQEESKRKALISRLWSRLWPKLAALALALVLWQLVVASGWRPKRPWCERPTSGTASA
jgi:NitT/TauT family transport system permease protein